MQLIANKLNNTFLSNCFPAKDTEIDGVYAAIAYGDDTNGMPKLIENCLDNKYRLDIWMRYDENVPVAPSLLKKLLQNQKNNIFCQLIPDMFHSKIIWWKGWGVYIGSANLTERGWFSNIETGIFLNESEIDENELETQLSHFFFQLEELDVSTPLSKEIIEEQIEFARSKSRQSHSTTQTKERFIPQWGGPAFIKDSKNTDKYKERFREEWFSTLGYMRSIAEQIDAYRPCWIEEGTYSFWQLDQFLHAYYYNHVRQADNTYPFDALHQQNKANPQAALIEQLTWWQALPSPPSNEDIHLNEYAPTISDLLSKENIHKLDEDKFIRICHATHATKDHIIKIPLSHFGITDITTLSRDERIPLYAKMMFSMRNKRGQNLVDLLNYVLYGGKPDDIWERIYTATQLPEHKLKHYGISSICEIAGWAMPEHLPPRNGRTNKALRALGYPVKLF